MRSGVRFLGASAVALVPSGKTIRQNLSRRCSGAGPEGALANTSAVIAADMLK